MGAGKGRCGAVDVFIFYTPPDKKGGGGTHSYLVDAGMMRRLFLGRNSTDVTVDGCSNSWEAVGKVLQEAGARVHPPVALTEQDFETPFSLRDYILEKVCGCGGPVEKVRVIFDVTRGNRKDAIAVVDAIRTLEHMGFSEDNFIIVHGGYRVGVNGPYWVVEVPFVSISTYAREWYELDPAFYARVSDMVRSIKKLLGSRRINYDRYRDALTYVLDLYTMLFYAVSLPGRSYFWCKWERSASKDLEQLVELLGSFDGDEKSVREAKNLAAKVKLLRELVDEFFNPSRSRGSRECQQLDRLKEYDPRLLFLEFYYRHGHTQRFILFATELLKSYVEEILVVCGGCRRDSINVSELVGAAKKGGVGERRKKLEDLLANCSRSGKEGVISVVIELIRVLIKKPERHLVNCSNIDREYVISVVVGLLGVLDRLVSDRNLIAHGSGPDAFKGDASGPVFVRLRGVDECVAAGDRTSAEAKRRIENSIRKLKNMLKPGNSGPSYGDILDVVEKSIELLRNCDQSRE